MDFNICRTSDGNVHCEDWTYLYNRGMLHRPTRKQTLLRFYWYCSKPIVRHKALQPHLHEDRSYAFHEKSGKWCVNICPGELKKLEKYVGFYNLFIWKTKNYNYNPFFQSKMRPKHRLTTFSLNIELEEVGTKRGVLWMIQAPVFATRLLWSIKA